MADLRDLYQEVILDHTKRPRNFRPLEQPTCSADGHNPLCGDKVTVFVELDGDRIANVTFQGSGCAISTASASMLTEALRGKTVAEAEAMFQQFHHLVTSRMGTDAPTDKLGKLAVFAGVREFPMRVKCATLPWHTLQAALKRSAHEPVSTE